MKNAKILICAVLLIMGFFTVYSCQKIEEGYGYLRIDHSSYMFRSDGSDTCKIVVESNRSWSVGEIPDWVSVLEKGDDYVMFVAEANDSNIIRMGEVSFISDAESPILSLSQTFKKFNGRFFDLTTLNAPAMSRNGKFVAGMRGVLDENDRGIFTPVIINTTTGETEELDQTYDFNAIKYVGNDGNVVVLSNSYSGRTEMFIDGEMVNVNIPDGYFNYRIYSASDDNTIWVGYCQNESTKRYHPVRWINGEPEFLDMPSSNLWGQDVSHNGTMVRGCSADGSVMYGTEWDTRGLVYWKDGVMNFIGGDPNYNILGYDNPEDPNELTSYTGIVADASTTRISPNGRYISAAWYSFYNGYMVTMVDVETGNVKIIESLGDSGGESVDNEGNFFAGIPYKGPVSGYVMGFDREPVPVTDWFISEYGLNFVDGYMVKSVSEDGKTILGARAMMTVYGVMYSFWCVATDVFEE